MDELLEMFRISCHRYFSCGLQTGNYLSVRSEVGAKGKIESKRGKDFVPHIHTGASSARGF